MTRTSTGTPTFALRGLLAAAAFAAIVSLPAAQAQEAYGEDSIFDYVSLDLGVDLYSHYIWRGMLLTDDPVAQPSITAGIGGFSLNVWGSIDMTDVNEQTPGDPFGRTSGPTWNLQELDFTASYAVNFEELVDLEIGFIYYTFPGTVFPATEEVYASIGVAVPFLNPSVSVYWDYDEADGVYANGSIGHTFPINEVLGVSVGGAIGVGSNNFNEYYYGVADSAFSDWNVSASLDYAPTENFSMSLIFAYSDIIDGDLADAAAAGYGEDGIFYGGLSFGYSF